MQRVQSSGHLQALAQIPYNRNTNFGERSRAHALLNTPLESSILCIIHKYHKLFKKMKVNNHLKVKPR